MPVQQVSYQQVNLQQTPAQQVHQHQAAVPEFAIHEMPTQETHIAEMPATERGSCAELPAGEMPVELLADTQSAAELGEPEDSDSDSTTSTMADMLEVPKTGSQASISRPQGQNVRRSSSVYVPVRQSMDIRRSSSVYTASQQSNHSRPNSSLNPFTDVAWNPPRASVSDEPIERRLSKAIASVLGLDGDEVSRDDSFMDLGGDQHSAKELRNTCKGFGLSVRSRDILTCKTLAELETKVTPLTTSPPLGTKSPYAVSPLTLKPSQQPGVTAKEEEAQTPVRWSMVDDGGILRAPTVKHAQSLRRTASVSSTLQPSSSIRHAQSVRRGPSLRAREAPIMERPLSIQQSPVVEEDSATPQAPTLRIPPASSQSDRPLSIQPTPIMGRAPSLRASSIQATPAMSRAPSISIARAPSVKEVPEESNEDSSYTETATAENSADERKASLRPPNLRKSSSQPRLTPKSSKRYHNKVEQILSLNGDVSKAAVLKPKAGPFEGQPVAFISLTSCVVEAKQDSEVKLLDSSYYTSQLPAIRRSVETKVQASSVPKVWCLIEKLPLDEFNRVSRRCLQTWIQNANEEIQSRIVCPDSEKEEEATQPKTPTQKKLQRAISKAFDIDQKSVGMNSSFSKLGGDSAKAEELMIRGQTQGLSLKASDILQSSSFAELAANAEHDEGHTAPLEEIGEEFDLSPMQRLYFHTTLGGRTSSRTATTGDYRFNQSVMFHFKKPTEMDDVRAAVEVIVEHHPMLRTLFHDSEDSWVQHTITDIPSSYHFEQHEVSTDKEVEDIIARVQASIDVENGPVFSAQFFKMGDGHQMLHLVAHHLVVDLRSWRIIADDLDGLLTDGSLVSGRGLSFKDWAEKQFDQARLSKSRKNFPPSASSSNQAYWGVNEEANSYGNLVKSSFTLGAETTAMLNESNNALRTDSADIFMAGLILSFCRTFKDRGVPAVWNQEHDRATLDSKTDISETVGWFTSLYPLALNTSPDDDFFKVLMDVKDSRRCMLQRGAPSFAASLMDANSTAKFTSNFIPLEILFTYVGSIQNLNKDKSSLEQIPIPGYSLTSKTSDIGKSVGRIALFEISVSMDAGETKVKFLHHQKSKYQDLIESWYKTYETLLVESIPQLQKQSPSLSRADMPLLDLSYEKLQTLNKEILPSLNINIADVETIYPVSAVQQSILINESLVPGSGRIQAIYELTTLGSYIDISRLCAAWQQVSRQYTALRTVFVESPSKDDLYDQIILKRHSPNMLFIEAGHADGALSALRNLAPVSSTLR